MVESFAADRGVLNEQSLRGNRFPDKIPDHWKVQDGYECDIGRRSDAEIEIVARPGAPGRTRWRSCTW